jgi:predicted AAA+ superfamily ATPase
VHYLIEEHDLKFALCGSSARKVKQGQANLLGGRAIKHELYGFTAKELGKDFDLVKIINQGYLPKHYLSPASKAFDLQNFYINDYLKEEIAAEALVRNLPVFSEFLRAAAFSDAEMVNYSNIARDCGVSANTVKEYFHILEDTLMAKFLPAFCLREKRKVIRSPKFYYSDLGVVNGLLKRKEISIGSELFGKAFENWVHHELRAYNSYHKAHWDLSYWRLANGSAEVDFIINDMQVAIEAKASHKIKKDELKGLRELIKDQEQVGRRIVVSLVDTDRLTDDGIEVIGYQSFVKMLWAGEIRA